MRESTIAQDPNLVARIDERGYIVEILPATAGGDPVLILSLVLITLGLLFTASR